MRTGVGFKAMASQGRGYASQRVTRCIHRAREGPHGQRFRYLLLLPSRPSKSCANNTCYCPDKGVAGVRRSLRGNAGEDVTRASHCNPSGLADVAGLTCGLMSPKWQKLPFCHLKILKMAPSHVVMVKDPCTYRDVPTTGTRSKSRGRA